jgi:hypothetical protein
MRSHLDSEEVVVAVGRCEDITEGGSIDWGGGATTYVMITNQHVRWVPLSFPQYEASVSLDAITDVSERLVGHRYAITLEHAPISRLHHVPAHRFLMFEWGNADARIDLSRTILAFSRRDTHAADGLREQLARRSIL